MEVADIEGEERQQVATAVGCPSETALAGKADVCRGCPGRELCLSSVSSVDADQKFIDVRMRAVGRKILILSGKGGQCHLLWLEVYGRNRGVGKSCIASCLSMALAELSAKVGAVDLDICGPSMPKLMAVEGMEVVNSRYGWIPLNSPHHGIKVMSVGCLLEGRDNAVVWRGPRKTALIKRFAKDTFWGRLDYLLFDEHLSVVKVLMNMQPEGAILVCSPQEVALATLRKEINFCRKMKLNIIGIVENMSGFQCPCCQEHWPLFSSGGAVKLAEEYGLPLLATVPLNPVLVECCEEGRNIFQDHRDSPAARVLMELARNIHEKNLPTT